MQRRTFVTAAAATLAAPMLQAQTLPSGPVRIIVGFPPGGGTDALARVVGQKLSAMWGLSVLIDNKPGAAGVHRGGLRQQAARRRQHAAHGPHQQPRAGARRWA